MFSKGLRSLFLGLVGAVLVVALAGAVGAEVALPVLPKAKASAVPGKWECVEPTEDMRRNHMKYLLHHRDDTMHQGIRTQQHSLKECIECHVVPWPNNQPVSIKSREHFCNSCHAYAAVKIDCWECHNPQPAKSPPSPPIVKRGAGGVSQLSSAQGKE